MVKQYIQIFLSSVFFLTVASWKAGAQPVPGEAENIPYLITFGGDGETSWGDDDFSQTWFFTIPADFNQPFYIRIFDPDTGGEHDEINGLWNTRMRYSVYGGAGCYTHPDAKGIDPTGNYHSGTQLFSRVFGADPARDNQWFTFGPLNPAEGEFVAEFNSYVFKIICDGIAGDDGNNYRYFLSRDADSNRPIEGANAFTYEYTFRMWNDHDNVMHIYPYVDTGCIYVRVFNFDWDSDGDVMVVSEVRKGQLLKVSGEDHWTEDRINVDPREIGKSYDFQFHKRKDMLVGNNNVVVRVENQYGEMLRFFSVPIGGVPRYNPQAAFKPINRK